MKQLVGCLLAIILTVTAFEPDSVRAQNGEGVCSPNGETVVSGESSDQYVCKDGTISSEDAAWDAVLFLAVGMFACMILWVVAGNIWNHSEGGSYNHL